VRFHRFTGNIENYLAYVPNLSSPPLFYNRCLVPSSKNIASHEKLHCSEYGKTVNRSNSTAIGAIALSQIHEEFASDLLISRAKPGRNSIIRNKQTEPKQIILI